MSHEYTKWFFLALSARVSQINHKTILRRPATRDWYFGMAAMPHKWIYGLICVVLLRKTLFADRQKNKSRQGCRRASRLRAKHGLMEYPINPIAASQNPNPVRDDTDLAHGFNRGEDDADLAHDDNHGVCHKAKPKSRQGWRRLDHGFNCGIVARA